MLLPQLFDTVSMKSPQNPTPLKLPPTIQSPPKSRTIISTREITPSIPHPTYPILCTFLRKPTNQSSGGVVDDVAIHSPTILPSLILTPSKTAPFNRISFNFSLNFLSSSAWFLVRSGEMSLKFSEFENFWDSGTTLHLTATDSIFKLTSWFLPKSALSISSASLSLSTHRSYPSHDTVSKSQVPSYLLQPFHPHPHFPVYPLLQPCLFSSPCPMSQ